MDFPEARDRRRATPQSGEDEQLEAEKRVLANAEKIYNAAMNAFDLLYEGNGSTASSLRAAQKQVEELATLRAEISRSARRTRERAHQRRRCRRDSARLRGRNSGFAGASGPGRGPAALLDRLKRKYGPTLDEVIPFEAEVSRKLSEVENKDEILGELRTELVKAAEEYLRVGEDLVEKASGCGPQARKVG